MQVGRRAHCGGELPPYRAQLLVVLAPSTRRSGRSNRELEALRGAFHDGQSRPENQRLSQKGKKHHVEKTTPAGSLALLPSPHRLYDLQDIHDKLVHSFHNRQICLYGISTRKRSKKTTFFSHSSPFQFLGKSRGHRCRPFSPPVLSFIFYRA